MNGWAQVLLLWSWQSLLLIGFILIAVTITRAQSAASRHSFWLLTLVVVSILPVINAVVRVIPVETPVSAPIGYIAQISEVTAEALPAATQSAAARDLIPPTLFALWIVGVFISTVRSLRAYRQWHRIVRSAFGIERSASSIAMGYSTEVETPVLIGTLHPMIVLPANIDTWTNDEERRAVLLHELAHAERRDHWVSPLQAFLGAVFFFHPAVRYALRQLILERELACDEHVLAMGTSPSIYAEVILRVAEHSIPGRQSDCPAFNAPGKILERRIEMILSYRSSIAGRWSFPAIGRAAIVLALASLLLPQRSLIAETPMPPRLEFRTAAFQPLTEAAAVIARAIPTKAVAQPASPTEESPQPAQAIQTDFGTISGTVVDPTGALVPGVDLSLASVTGQVLDGIAFVPDEVRLARTNQAGAFAFTRVPAGEWKFQASVPGFTYVPRSIQVRSGEALVQKVSLTVANVSTTVDVVASRPGAPQNAGRTSPPQRIGGDIIQPRLIFQVKPVYPAAARNSEVQDFVQLQATIGKDGAVVSLQVQPNRKSPGNSDLEKAAMDAVQLWRYSPGILNGVPIEIATTIRVNFTLD